MKRTNAVFLPALIPAVFAMTQIFFSCAGQGGSRADVPARYPKASSSTERMAGNPGGRENDANILEPERVIEILDSIAELERSGHFRAGMGANESMLRELQGDYAGSIIAGYKEMSYFYGFGVFGKERIEQGMESLIAIDEMPWAQRAVPTARALLAFTLGRWDEAEKGLKAVFGEIDEPDHFVNLLLLSCAMEKNPGDRKAAEAYRAIRARYVKYPEYWYRGARLFPGSIGSEYAETCINLAPDGPFTSECRGILAVFSGLKAEDGASIKSKIEIETLIARSVNEGNPELLSDLMPLIGLPDNHFTVYATGALRSLVSVPVFREYFVAVAAGSNGRLADRLAYICRG
ncbi:MAG: hypothetical protein FWH38_09725 [Treponema sp.]|nr:hypothetical protein [Treponema sp.]